MVFALLVLLVTSLLTAAVFLAVQDDATLTGADLAGKRAYAAAQAGVQTYLYNLNSNSANSAWWETCSNDVSPGAPTPVAVSANAGYTYAPVVNGGGACSATDPVGSLIDSAGNLRIAVTGTSGSASRTIVASLRTLTPLSYLWYTVHETLDPAADSKCAGDPFYYNQTAQNQIPDECQINWFTGDKVNGPLYTEDQLLIGSGASPSFGAVTSEAPSTDPKAVCVASSCQNATFSTTPQTVLGGAQQVKLPPQNGSLETDAQKYGIVYTGTTSITLNGSTATVKNCPTASTCVTTNNVSLSQYPIIYVANDTSQGTACNTSYSPQSGISYQATPSGPCGDIYVTGTYSKSVTLASENDIIVQPGSVGGVISSTDSSPTGTAALTGTATLGLVADEYVRVYHPQSGSGTSCTATNPNMTIDGAILTLQGSFMVDNYTCGGAYGTLTVHGAIAQEYRGAVGTNKPAGYLKNYNYDTRLSEILPPYLFDLQTTGWSILRETLCSQVGGGCSGS
jgi:hypothetical protein